jgi:tRNA (cytidine56-2'-O)-methyltransferase
MYGEPHGDVLPRLADVERVLFVVGAEKVPAELYQLATHNCSVGNQPHSEVAALAVMLHGLLGDAPLYAERAGATMQIEPAARGKRVR